MGDGRFGSSLRRNGQYLEVDLEGGCYVESSKYLFYTRTMAGTYTEVRRAPRRRMVQ